MIRLDVWLTLPDGENIQCGELAFSDADNLEHVLNFDLNPTIKTEVLADLGRKWGIARSKSVVEEVMGVMPRYVAIAERFDVPEQDVARFCHVA